MAVKQKAVEKALRRLGRTKSAVTRTLEQGGFRGTPGEQARCPVAQYLHAAFPDEVVSVDVVNVEVDGVMVRATDAVNDFVGAFDEGDEPALA